MRTLVERNIDAEMFALLEQDNESFHNRIKEYYEKENNFPINADKNPFDAAYWTKKLNRKKQDHNQNEEFPNPFAELGNTKESQNKKEPGVLEKVSNWINENTGKAILTALLIGGGAYLLKKHLWYAYNADQQSTANSKRKHKVKKKKSEPEGEVNEYSIKSKEITLGMVAAVGGTVIGTLLKDYSLPTAVSIAVVGLSGKNIIIIAAALGLVLSKTVKSGFYKFFDTESEEREMKRRGYVETMLGYIKLDKPVLSDS